MGAVAAKCSDLSKHAGPNKLPDAEDEEDDEDGEDEDEEDDEDDEEAELREMRSEAETALSEGLSRGKTSTFNEVIDHAKGIGIDPEKIRKAEERLQQHKANRRREAFEAEMQAFLKSDESNDIDACKEKVKQGAEYGVGESALGPLREKMDDLHQSRDLEPDEIAQAKAYIELCTRKFVRSCVKEGRDTTWMDLESFKKAKARIKLDLILKNLRVEGRAGDQEHSAMKLGDAVAKRAADVDEVARSSAFGKLTSEERDCAVAVVGNEDPWLLLEPSLRSQDELIVAITILNGTSLEESGAKSARGKKKGKDRGGKSPAVPLAVAAKSAKSERSERGWQEEEDEEEEEEEEEPPAASPRTNNKRRQQETNNSSPMADSPPLPPPAELEDNDEDAEPPEEPVERPEKDKKEKKEKKEKKDKKDKKEKKDS